MYEVYAKIPYPMSRYRGIGQRGALWVLLVCCVAGCAEPRLNRRYASSQAVTGIDDFPASHLSRFDVRGQNLLSGLDRDAVSLSDIRAARDVASVLASAEPADVPAGDVGDAAAMNPPVAPSADQPAPVFAPPPVAVAAPAIVPAVEREPVPPAMSPVAVAAAVPVPAPVATPAPAAANPLAAVPADVMGAVASTDPAVGGSLLKPGIKLNVTVYGSGVKEYSEQDKPISADGKLVLPLVGEVRVANKTLAVLRDELTAAYGQYLRKPVVEVAFSANNPADLAPWGYVTVLGRVVKPGRINLLPGGDMTVSLAIQKVGGLGPGAKDNAIMVVRKTGDGAGVERFQIDLNDAARKGAEADFRLQSGDVVFVPVSMF